MLLRQVDFAALGVRPDDAMLLSAPSTSSRGRVPHVQQPPREITADAVLASAAIPTMFRAVHLDGGTYWDGLFSQNPPVRELADPAPDEIWVIQINPPERETEPTTVVEIADRRNELAGNLSLHQELHFIEKIDELLEEGVLAPGGRYRPIMVRVIELSRSRLSAWLGAASKLNRDPRVHRRADRHGDGAGGRVPRRARLRARVARRRRRRGPRALRTRTRSSLPRAQTATSQRSSVAGWPMA